MCFFYFKKWIYWLFRKHINFGNVFVRKITLKNFPDDWSYSFTVIALFFFFKRDILKNVKKIWKNSCGYRKINKFIWNEKNQKGYQNIYSTTVFFNNLLITLWHYYCAKWMFPISLIFLIFFPFSLIQSQTSIKISVLIKDLLNCSKFAVASSVFEHCLNRNLSKKSNRHNILMQE